MSQNDSADSSGSISPKDVVNILTEEREQRSPTKHQPPPFHQVNVKPAPTTAFNPPTAASEPVKLEPPIRRSGNRPSPIQLVSAHGAEKALEKHISVHKRSPFVTPQVSQSQDFEGLIRDRTQEYMDSLYQASDDWMSTIKGGEMIVMPGLPSDDEDDEPHSHNKVNYPAYPTIPEEHPSASATPPLTIRRPQKELDEITQAVKNMPPLMTPINSVDVVSEAVKREFGDSWLNPGEGSTSSSSVVDLRSQPVMVDSPTSDKSRKKGNELPTVGDIVDATIDSVMSQQPRGAKEWMTPEILSGIEERDQLFQEMKNCPEDHANYQTIAAAYKKKRNQVVTLTRRAKREYKNVLRPNVETHVHQKITANVTGQSRPHHNHHHNNQQQHHQQHHNHNHPNNHNNRPNPPSLQHAHQNPNFSRPVNTGTPPPGLSAPHAHWSGHSSPMSANSGHNSPRLQRNIIRQPHGPSNVARPTPTGPTLTGPTLTGPTLTGPSVQLAPPSSSQQQQQGTAAWGAGRTKFNEIARAPRK